MYHFVPPNNLTPNLRLKILPGPRGAFIFRIVSFVFGILSGKTYLNYPEGHIRTTAPSKCPQNVYYGLNCLEGGAI